MVQAERQQAESDFYTYEEMLLKLDVANTTFKRSMRRGKQYLYPAHRHLGKRILFSKYEYEQYLRGEPSKGCHNGICPSLTTDVIEDNITEIKPRRQVIR
jgi:hypothetical protein